MRRVVAAFFIGLTVVAVPQDRKPEIVARPSGPVPYWNRGQVEGRTYRNASVGIELTPPPGLEFGAPELNGNPGTLPLLVTITAVGEYKLLTARNVMAFYADALAYYPSSKRSTDAYMAKIVGAQQSDGYELVESTSYGKLGGIVFARQDFRKGVVYESFLVRACDAQALVFIFGSGNQESVNKLSSATELTLDPATSGCISHAASPTQGNETEGDAARKVSDALIADLVANRLADAMERLAPRATPGWEGFRKLEMQSIDQCGRPLDGKIQNNGKPYLGEDVLPDGTKTTWTFQYRCKTTRQPSEFWITAELVETGRYKLALTCNPDPQSLPVPPK